MKVRRERGTQTLSNARPFAEISNFFLLSLSLSCLQFREPPALTTHTHTDEECTVPFVA